jgi:hypothetical protein
MIKIIIKIILNHLINLKKILKISILNKIIINLNNKWSKQKKKKNSMDFFKL